MSYDIRLVDPVTKEGLHADEKHMIHGGMFAMGGTTELWMNISWNYSDFFYEHIDEEKGIRAIYGMSGADSIPVLESAIAKLKDDATDDYWEATEGNAKRDLYGLLALAKLRPDGIWDGD